MGGRALHKCYILHIRFDPLFKGNLVKLKKLIVKKSNSKTNSTFLIILPRFDQLFKGNLVNLKKLIVKKSNSKTNSTFLIIFTKLTLKFALSLHV